MTHGNCTSCETRATLVNPTLATQVTLMRKCVAKTKDSCLQRQQALRNPSSSCASSMACFSLNCCAATRQSHAGRRPKWHTQQLRHDGPRQRLPSAPVRTEGNDPWHSSEPRSVHCDQGANLSRLPHTFKYIERLGLIGLHQCSCSFREQLCAL